MPDTAGHAQNPPETDISFRRDRVDAPPQHQSSAAAEYARRLTPPRRGRKIHNDAALQGRTTADWQPAAASEAGRISAEVRKYGRPELCSGSGYYGRPWRRVLRAALSVDLNRAAQLPATEFPRFPASQLPGFPALTGGAYSQTIILVLPQGNPRDVRTYLPDPHESRCFSRHATTAMCRHGSDDWSMQPAPIAATAQGPPSAQYRTGWRAFLRHGGTRWRERDARCGEIARPNLENLSEAMPTAANWASIGEVESTKQNVKSREQSCGLIMQTGTDLHLLLLTFNLRLLPGFPAAR